MSLARKMVRADHLRTSPLINSNIRLPKCNPKAFILPAEASPKVATVQRNARPSGLQHVSRKRSRPEVIEERGVDGSLRGLILAGNISMMPGGYEAVFERYQAQGELQELLSVEFRDVTPWEDELADAVCDLVPYTSQLEEFVMYNCVAPSMEGWMAMLLRMQRWASLKKMVHSGDKVGSVLLGMGACYHIPAVAGLDNEALLAMAAHVRQAQPWEHLEELRLQNIVYPVRPTGEDPQTGLSVHMDGRNAIKQVAHTVWPYLQEVHLDPVGLDGWVKRSERSHPQEA